MVFNGARPRYPIIDISMTFRVWLDDAEVLVDKVTIVHYVVHHLLIFIPAFGSLVSCGRNSRRTVTDPPRVSLVDAGPAGSSNRGFVDVKVCRLWLYTISGLTHEFALFDPCSAEMGSLARG